MHVTQRKNKNVMEYELKKMHKKLILSIQEEKNMSC